MKIVLLLGSPNRQGSSRMLAESFVRERKKPDIKWS